MSSTLFLQGAVKAFDMGVVVWSAKPGVTYYDTVRLEGLLEVVSELRAIVGLHHGEWETKCLLSSKDGKTYRPSYKNWTGIDDIVLSKITN